MRYINITSSLFALLLFVCSDVSAQENMPEPSFQTSEEWKEYSVRFNKSGDFERGFKYLNKAVEMSPIDHLGYRGWIRLRKLRDYDKALNDFNRLDSLTPNYNDAAWGEELDYLRGESYLGKKDFIKARFYFERVIENAESENWVAVQTFNYLGICELEMKNYQIAVSQFKKTLKYDENSCDAYYFMAKSLFKLKNYSLSLEQINIAELKIFFKRDDAYNEFLYEIYLADIQELKSRLTSILNN